jgi:hypothetical protein
VLSNTVVCFKDFGLRRGIQELLQNLKSTVSPFLNLWLHVLYERYLFVEIRDVFLTLPFTSLG